MDRPYTTRLTTEDGELLWQRPSAPVNAFAEAMHHCIAQNYIEMNTVALDYGEGVPRDEGRALTRLIYFLRLLQPTEADE